MNYELKNVTKKEHNWYFSMLIARFRNWNNFRFFFPYFGKSLCCYSAIKYTSMSNKRQYFIIIILARTPEIGQGLGRLLRCGACKQEQEAVF